MISLDRVYEYDFPDKAREGGSWKPMGPDGTRRKPVRVEVRAELTYYGHTFPLATLKALARCGTGGGICPDVSELDSWCLRELGLAGGWPAMHGTDKLRDLLLTVGVSY